MKITATVELKVTMEAPSAAEAHRLLLEAYKPGEVHAATSDNSEDVRHTVTSRHVRIWPAKKKRP